MTGTHILYSASANKGRGAFFDPDVGYPLDDLPSDCVRIRRSRHVALLAGMAQGYQIIADKTGKPRLNRFGPLSNEAARAGLIKAIKREAARRINRQMPIWRQINALRDNADPGFHQIDLIRSASDMIEEQLQSVTSLDEIAEFPVANNPLWPEFDISASKD